MYVIASDHNRDKLADGQTLLRIPKEGGKFSWLDISASSLFAWRVEQEVIIKALRENRYERPERRPDYLLHEEQPSPDRRQLHCRIYSLSSYDHRSLLRTCCENRELSGYPMSRRHLEDSWIIQKRSFFILARGPSIWRVVAIRPHDHPNIPTELTLEPFGIEDPGIVFQKPETMFDFLPPGAPRKDAEDAYRSLAEATKRATDWPGVCLSARRVIEKTLFAVLVARGVLPNQLNRDDLNMLIARARQEGVLRTDTLLHAAHLSRLLGDTDHPQRANREGVTLGENEGMIAGRIVALVLNQIRAATAGP
jgi:hypothetical protein